MFKKYAVETRLVRTNKKTDSPEPIEDFVPDVDYAQIARETAEHLHVITKDGVKMLIVGALAYVAADTVRQVIVKSTKSR